MTLPYRKHFHTMALLFQQSASLKGIPSLFTLHFSLYQGGGHVDVFRRRELKFLLDEGQRKALEALMEARMVPDKYGRKTICNLYYDTDDFRLIRHSLEKPVYKEKLRLRSYGRIGPGVDVFLEMKKKYKGIVYKRRIAVTQEQAFAFMERRSPLPKDCQIGRELRYFRDLYGSLSPKVYISYERLAWFDPNDGGFRVTLDWDVEYRTKDLDLYLPTGGKKILEPGQSLLEVKASGGIPLWMSKFLSEQGLSQQSFSKYGRAYQELLLEELCCFFAVS